MTFMFHECLWHCWFTPRDCYLTKISIYEIAFKLFFWLCFLGALQFSQHNLQLEAACPALYVDQDGTYWDVPLSMGVDLASVASPSGINYHLSLQHNSGQPKHLSSQKSQIPLSLLPGLCAKTVISIRRFVDFWRKKEGKLKMVQPYDAFLSDPHVSASGTIGKRKMLRKVILCYEIENFA